MKQKLCAPFSDSQSKEFIWRTRRNARAFNAEHHGEWEKMMHGLLQRPSPSTRTWWARIEGPLSDWEIGICASVSRYAIHDDRSHCTSGLDFFEPRVFSACYRSFERHSLDPVING
jgi:hypothetical protein